MPDDADYRYLGWLVEHPEEWTEADRESAESILANQKRAVDEGHPKDVKNRQSLRDVVDALECGLARHSAARR
jgi:hypothetical protein